MTNYQCKAVFRKQKTINFGTLIADDIDEALDGAAENLGEDVFEESVVSEFMSDIQDTSKWNITCKRA